MTPEIYLSSGHLFSLTNPNPELINVWDIANALSKICRYTGQITRFYSVAEHSVILSYMVPPEHAFAGLLHDAAEAYLGDVSAPLKSLLPEYRRLERVMEAAVFAAFGVDEMPACVKDADTRLGRWEQELLYGRPPDPTDPAVRPPIGCLTHGSAFTLFTDRFFELRGRRS